MNPSKAEPLPLSFSLTPPQAWAEHFRRELDRRKRSIRDVVEACGTSASEVSKWLEGSSVPASREAARLHAMLPALKAHALVLAAARASLSQGELRMAGPSTEQRLVPLRRRTVYAEALTPPEPYEPGPPQSQPGARAEPPTPTLAPAPAAAMPFGEALRAARRSADDSAPSVAALLECHSSLVYQWEKGRGVPTQSAYESLCKLYPSLTASPPARFSDPDVSSAARAARSKASKAPHSGDISAEKRLPLPPALPTRLSPPESRPTPPSIDASVLLTFTDLVAKVRASSEFPAFLGLLRLARAHGLRVGRVLRVLGPSKKSIFSKQPLHYPGSDLLL